MTTTPRIAVVGGGPGGLMCARVLHLHGIEAAVYDADAAVDARDAGGTLDLHADSGQIAMEDAGLTAEFAAVSRPESQAKTRRDQHGTLLAEFTPDEGDTAAPEIDRGQLRALLAAHLPSGTVRWGHKLTAAVPLGGGRHRLEFAHGSRAEADLVIGADGAWSRIRPLLTGAVPRYTGVTFVDIRFEDVDHRHPRVAEIVGDGHMFSSDADGRAIIGQRNSFGHVRVYAGLRTDRNWYERAGVDPGDPAAVRRHLLGAFDGWSPTLRELLDGGEGYVNRPLYALPAPLAWDRVPGATLLGDAAHLMTPFGGYGVNLAMLDGAELARALATEDGAEAAVTRYEAGMLPRAGSLAPGANDALARFFSSRPAAEAAADVPDHVAEHQRYRDAAADYRRTRTAGTEAAGRP